MQGAMGYVLVTDRNRNVREFLHRELLRRGFRASAARDAAEVLSALRSKEPPALLILDMDLPGCAESGFCEQLLASERRTFVMVHGFSEEDLPPALAGKAAKVSKDGNVDSLMRAVSWCLHRTAH